MMAVVGWDRVVQAQSEGLLTQPGAPPVEPSGEDCSSEHASTTPGVTATPTAALDLAGCTVRKHPPCGGEKFVPPL